MTKVGPEPAAASTTAAPVAGDKYAGRLRDVVVLP